MVKHPTSSRVHRETEAEDAFVARVVEYTEWARRNSRIVTTAAVVIVLLVAGFLYWRSYRAGMEERAAQRLTEIQQTVGSGNTALAMQDLESYLETFSGTSSARQARLLLGELYLDSERYREALSAVEPVAQDLGDPLGPSAAFLRAAALEAMEQPGRAEQVYLSIADAAEMDFYVRRAIADAARIRVDLGRPGEAADLYRRLLAMTGEDDPERGEYEMRLAEVETLAAQGALQQPGG